MGKIKKKNLGWMISFTTGLFIGILVGTLSFTLLISHRMDKHYETIENLTNIIEEKDIKLNKLEDSINAQNIVLQDIEIELIHEEEMNEMDKITIEKTIREKYNALFGKEIKTIDTEILVEVIDKRIFKIEDKEYRVYMDKLILTEILKLYVRIETKS
ncbi:hypothetical protein NSA47_07645 [Irregularibacter muris]|uniref:Sporulation membrane protein YtrI C-terminal domain-containing protein n=1 Tax=Irregularibacter muris TaxID=1796619 RepID=A0AAE3HE86_9FIRM|nr:hypothetical protein [Irregularibacter muris]MCR1898857.1 hypothetical protein [Irregularibacter muris]